jgi:outer membrane protein assembly factor BamA
VIWDRRDDPDLTTSGTLSEISYQKSYDWLGSDYLFNRYTFLHAHYYPVQRNKYILVNLVVLERLKGDAPFYELTEIGGSIRGFSVGGSATLRGFESRRFADRQKFLWTIELRRLFDDRRWLGQYLQSQAVTFIDLGRVAPNLKDLTPNGLHYDAGAGFRATWTAQLTVRIDYAVSPEDRRLLLSFGNLF